MKVFSVEKFKKVLREAGVPEDKIQAHVNCWANDCEGLTEEEMNKVGNCCSDSWMVEKEEKDAKII